MSRPTSAVILASASAYTVFMTCSNAVSVERPCRYTDCSREKFGDESRCGCSLSSTSCSITFEMDVRLDICSLSTPGFLSKGSTCAVLNAAGKQHSANDKLDMCDTTGGKVVAHERSRTDGSTSTGDDLRGLDVSSLSTSAAVLGASKDSVGPVCKQVLKIAPLDCSKLAAMD